MELKQEDLPKVTGVPISFKEYPDEHFILYLQPARKNRQLFAKFLSIAVPVFTAGADGYMDYSKQIEEYTKAVEDGYDEIVGQPKANIVDTPLMLATQLMKPEFDEIMEGLTENLYYAAKISGEYKPAGKVNLDEAFCGDDFTLYLLILEHSARAHFAGPLAGWLKAKGLPEIGSILQSAKSLVAESINPK